MDIVAILYFMVGLAYLLYEIKYISKTKKLSMVSVFRAMFMVSYGFLPAIISIRMIMGISNSTKLFVSSEDFISSMLIFLPISIIEYLIFNFVFEKTRPSKAYFKEVLDPDRKSQKIGLTFVIALGIASLFLWTKEFGYISGFMLHADGIRAGYFTQYNPWAFMEHFTKVMPVSAFVALSLFLRERREKRISFYSVLLMLVAIAFTLITMLCTDARGQVGAIVIIFALSFFNDKIANDKCSVLRAIVTLAGVAVVALILIEASGTIMNTIRFGSAEKSTFDLFDTLENEFGYTTYSQIACLKSLLNNPLQAKFFTDTFNAIFSWIPSRFIPFELPLDYWDYNTSQVNLYAATGGQYPADFITSSLYYFGVFGIVIFPVLFATILKKIDTFLRRKTYSHYLNAYYSRFMYYCVWWVTHFSISYTTLSLFGMFLVVMSIKIASNITKNHCTV